MPRSIETTGTVYRDKINTQPHQHYPQHKQHYDHPKSTQSIGHHNVQQDTLHQLKSFARQQQPEKYKAPYEDKRLSQEAVDKYYDTVLQMVGQPVHSNPYFANPAIPIGVPGQMVYDPMQQGPFYKPQISNTYNVHVGELFGNVSGVAQIYEDILPKKNINTSFIKISERLILYDYMRSIFTQDGLGSDIHVGTNKYNVHVKGVADMLARVKFEQITPYRDYTNPIDTRLFISNVKITMRACHPIMYDSRDNKVMCSDNSTSIMITLIPERETGNNNFVQNHVQFRIFVTDTFIKQQICPHFVITYAIYSINGGTDFNELYKKKFGTHPDPKFKQNAVIVLSEAPTFSLRMWHTHHYGRENNHVLKMIYNGSHSLNVWKSVIFQIMVAIYTMDIYRISLTEIPTSAHDQVVTTDVVTWNSADSVYIKKTSGSDHTTTDQMISCWKYIVNDIEYYVPNYGYVVMIDPDACTVDWDESYKASKNILFLKGILQDCQTFDKSTGLSRYCDHIMGTLDQTGSIYSSIFEVYREYLNNRIGTSLHDIELVNVADNEAGGEFNRGELLVLANNKFGLCLGGGNIIDSITGDIIISASQRLRKYSMKYSIMQNQTSNHIRLNDDNIIETYRIGEKKFGDQHTLTESPQYINGHHRHVVMPHHAFQEPFGDAPTGAPTGSSSSAPQGAYADGPRTQSRLLQPAPNNDRSLNGLKHTVGFTRPLHTQQ
jgi:hypothetical protein